MLLAAALVVGNVMPVMAAVSEEAIVYTEGEENVKADGTKACEVTVTCGSEWTVTIPKTITMSGETKSATYNVNVKGNYAGNKVVKVIPSENFDLVQAGKSNVTATVNQEKQSFTYGEAAKTGEVEGSTVNIGTDAQGSISAELTAGAWSGTFNFTVSLETATPVTP